MRKIIIFGSNGGLGTEISKLLNLKKKFKLILPNKKKIDFNKKNSSFKIKKILQKENPDYIINCAGIFGTNKIEYKEIFNVNFRSNWDIANFYVKKKNKIKKKILIYFIGSSSFNKPRKNYILYAASKSALNSMCKSLKDYFKNSYIRIMIIHPTAMKTNMRKKFNFLTNSKSKKEINPKKIAKRILLNIK